MCYNSTIDQQINLAIKAIIQLVSQSIKKKARN